MEAGMTGFEETPLDILSFAQATYRLRSGKSGSKLTGSLLNDSLNE
jgi:hypothetical protein